MLRALRIAIRSLRTRKLAFLLTVSCLGAGLGVATLAVGFTAAVLWRLPDGVARPRQVYRVRIVRAGLLNRVPGVSYPLFRTFQSQSGLGASIAGFGSTAIQSEVGEQGPLEAQVVTGQYFNVLQVRAFVGRALLPPDDIVGAAAVAVVSYDCWRTAFASDPKILGRRVRLNGTPFTVVGVAPPRFVGIDGGRVDVWVTTAMAPSIGLGARALTDSTFSWLRLVGRGSDGGARFAQAVARGVHAALPGEPARFELQRLLPPALADRGLARGSAGPARATVANVNAVAISMLVLAISNCCVLLLLRIESRLGEFAIRRALGASQSRVAMTVVAEAVITCAVAMWVGFPVVLLGRTLLRLIPGAAPGFPIGTGLVLADAAGALIALGGSALIPTFMAARGRLVSIIGTGTSSTKSPATRVRNWLVLIQTALATTVLFGALLSLDGLWRAARVDTGMSIDQLVAITVPAGDPEVPSLLTAVRTIPGVQAATRSLGNPFHTDLEMSVRTSRAAAPTTLRYSLVDTGYFRSVGTPVVAGRDLTADEIAGGPASVVVNQSLARALWGSPSAALGRCLYLPEHAACTMVRGVSRDAIYGSLSDGALPAFFSPLMASGLQSALPTTILVRADSPDARDALSLRLRALARGVAAPGSQPLVVRPVRAFLARELDDARTKATIFAVLAACAMAIGALGVYAVQAYNVALRTKEIAIRRALGAPRRNIGGLLVRDSVVYLSGGMLCGAALCVLLYAPLSGILFDVQAARPLLAFGLVAALFSLVAIAAMLIPLVSVASISPAAALRSE